MFGRELDARATIVSVPARQRERIPVHRTNACRNDRGRMSTDSPQAWFQFVRRDAIARENVNANLSDSPSFMADSCVSSNRILPHFLAVEDAQAGLGMIKSVVSPPWASALRRNSKSTKSTEPNLYRPI
jgi:hypothetical protein